MTENLEKNLEKLNIPAFREDLIEWFRAEQRDLPWRRDKDPYKIWVSEIMLQQTRVDTVIPYFERFIEKYPTLEAFAAADEEAIHKIWEGLGYYSRVRNLQAAVREVVANYGGKVPDNPKQIALLKGVGPYTAGAVLSIAYGIPEPAVDGNVMRVLSRILLLDDDIARPATRKVFEKAVRALISPEHPSDFNQGLMELGALICKPGTPACLLCPVREHCLAFEAGVQNELPVKTKKTKTRHEDRLSAVLEDAQGRILICKRPPTGLLANLWEFPTVQEGVPGIRSRQILQQGLEGYLGTAVELESGPFVQVDHAFSHLTWSISAYAGKAASSVEESETVKFVQADEVEDFAFPVSHQKIWQAYKETHQ